MTVYNYNAPQTNLPQAFQNLAASNSAMHERDLQQEILDKQAKQAREGLLGGIAGAAIGGLAAGPQGAAVGYSAGSMVGQAHAGGKVDPGQALQTGLAVASVAEKQQQASSERAALDSMRAKTSTGAAPTETRLGLGDPEAGGQTPLAASPAAVNADPETAGGPSQASTLPLTKKANGTIAPADPMAARMDAALAAARGSSTPFKTFQEYSQVANIINPPKIETFDVGNTTYAYERDANGQHKVLGYDTHKGEGADANQQAWVNKNAKTPGAAPEWVPGTYSKSAISALSTQLGNENVLTQAPDKYAGRNTEYERYDQTFRDLEQKIANGEKLTPAEVAEHNSAGQRLMKTTSTTDAQGNVHTQGGVDLAQIRKSIRGNKAVAASNDIPLPTPAAPQTTGKAAISAGEAGKKSSLQVAASMMPQIQAGILNKDGTVNRDNVLGMQSFLGFEGMPGSKGREVRQQMKVGIEAKIRADSGAAVPESEVNRYMAMYSPSPLDSDAMIKNKVATLNDYLTGTLSYVDFRERSKSFEDTPGAKQNLAIMEGKGTEKAPYVFSTPKEADAKYSKLKKGDVFIDPNGVRRRKP